MPFSRAAVDAKAVSRTTLRPA